MERSVEAETMTNLAQLASADWANAGHVSWAAASKRSIKNANSWLNHTCRERLQEFGMWSTER